MAIQEQFLTVAEVSSILNVSKDAVRKMFRRRQGVVRLSNARRPRMRIPESLLRAVMAEMGYVEVAGADGSGANGRGTLARP